MTKNILLIGGAGFIGSNLISKFISVGNYKIFVLQPQGSGCTRLEKFGSEISIFQFDLRDTASIEQLLVKNRIDVVIHLASTLLPNASLEDYQSEYVDLIIPSMSLLTICSRLSLLFVFVSSGGAVYGNSSSSPHKESDSLEPISFYGLAKYNMEEAVRFEHRRSGLRYLILRPSNPYGPGQNIYGKQGLIAVTFGKVFRREPIVIWGSGESIRDYIYIDDFSFYVNELLLNDVSDQVVNIGSGLGCSVNSIVEIISDAVNHKLDIRYSEQRTCDVNSSVLNIDHLLDLVSHRLNTSLKEGISYFYLNEHQKYDDLSGS